METDRELIAEKKAMLLTSGPITVPPDFRPPFPVSRSTAGPGAGSTSIVLAFDRTRVKKAFTVEKGEFELHGPGPSYRVTRNGRPFLDGVEVRPTLAHAPEQAFYNLDTECIYNCKFCTSPRLDRKIIKGLDPDKVVDLILRAAGRPEMKAVALTSAVVKDPQSTVDKMVRVVRKVRVSLPAMPIGVEPYVDSPDQIDQLKSAGADEIKLNLETYDRDLFEKVCGEQDFDRIMQAIEHAGRVFGRGKVTSNLIVGMGESDANVVEGVDALASLGCVATLRPLRINDLNRGPLTDALGELEPLTAERLVRLAKEHKRVLERHGLSSWTLHTMCHECGCCDLVPFRDL